MCERKSNLEPHPTAPPPAARGPGTDAAGDATSPPILVLLFLLLPRLVRLRSSSHPDDAADGVRSLSESRNRLPAWKDRVMRGGLSRDMEPRAMGGGLGDGDGVVHDGRGDSFPSSNAAGNDDVDDEPALSALTNAGGGGDPRVPPVAGDDVGDGSNDDSFFSNRKGGYR